MEESRTKKSIRNSIIALVIYFLNLFLQFFSRKVFLEHLGTELLGLNTTVLNILQFLNLAELGIGSAVGATLYKPLFNKDKKSINEIITLQGRLYAKIAYGIMTTSLILMLFFPYIFKKIELPLWYAYASYIVILFSSLLGYFVNYRQILLSADQKEYKIQLSYRLSIILKIGFQTIFIWNFDNGYIWWLIIEFMFAIIGSVWLSIIIKKTYPYLHKTSDTYKELRNKYPSIITKVKQLFFHKSAGFALTHISSILIYALSSLTMVAIYGNYLIIYSGIIGLMAAVFNGINGGIGNLIVENNSSKIIKFFNELFSLRFYIAMTISYIFFIASGYFVKLWIGEEYILPQNTTILISITIFIALTRQTVENFIYVKGMFQDIWAPIAETVINIGMSILLGKYFGLNGILTGTIISLIIIVLVWKPFFLFKYGLCVKVNTYWKIFFKHISIFSSTAIFCYIFYDVFLSKKDNQLIGLFIDSILFMSLSFLIMIISNCGIKNSIHRFSKLRLLHK